MDSTIDTTIWFKSILSKFVLLRNSSKCNKTKKLSLYDPYATMLQLYLKFAKVYVVFLADLYNHFIMSWTFTLLLFAPDITPSH